MRDITEVLTEASRDGRVCPQPQLWNQLWELLPERRSQGGGWNPPAPLILAAWWITSNEQKRERFRSHIIWAEQHGALDVVGDFIFALKPEDWHIEE